MLCPPDGRALCIDKKVPVSVFSDRQVSFKVISVNFMLIRIYIEKTG